MAEKENVPASSGSNSASAPAPSKAAPSKASSGSATPSKAVPSKTSWANDPYISRNINANRGLYGETQTEKAHRAAGGYVSPQHQAYVQSVKDQKVGARYSEIANYLNSGNLTIEKTKSYLQEAENFINGDNGHELLEYDEATGKATYSDRSWSDEWTDLANLLRDAGMKASYQNEIEGLKTGIASRNTLRQAAQNRVRSATSLATNLGGIDENGNIVEGDKHALTSGYWKNIIKGYDEQDAIDNAKLTALQNEMYEAFKTDEVRNAEAILQSADNDAYATDPSMLVSKEARNLAQMQIDNYNLELGLPTRYISETDADRSVVKSGAHGIEGALVGAAGTINKMADQANGEMKLGSETLVFNGTEWVQKTEEDTPKEQRRIGGELVPEAGEIAKQQAIANDTPFNPDSDPIKAQTAKRAQEYLDSRAAVWSRNATNLQAQYDKNAERIAEIEKADRSALDPQAVAELARERDRLKKENKALERDIKDARDIATQYGGGRGSISYYLRTGDREGFAGALDQISWDLGDKAQEELRKAQEGRNIVTKTAMNMVKTGMEMGFDSVVGAATGVGGLPVMFARVFGQASQEANRKGASLDRQVLYGLTVAGIEVLTEKIADFAGGAIYGKSFTGDLSKKLIHKLNASPNWETFLYAVADTLGEGAEEGLSDILAGFADMWIEYDKEKGFFQNWKDLGADDRANILYDVLLGSLMGAVGAGGAAVTGQYSAELAEQYNADLAKDIDARKGIRTATNEKIVQAARRDSASSDTIAAKIIEKGDSVSSSRLTSWINQMLMQPSERRMFESMTGQKVTGVKNEDQRASVRQILKDFHEKNGRNTLEGSLNRIQVEEGASIKEQESKDSRITKAKRKVEALAERVRNGEDVNEIDPRDKLTREEASILVASGIMTREQANEVAIPRGTRIATDQEITKAGERRAKGIKGYVGRILESDLNRMGRKRGTTPDVAQGEADEKERNSKLMSGLKEIDKKKVSGKNVDSSGKIEESNIRKTTAQAISEAEDELGIERQDGQSLPERLSTLERELGLPSGEGQPATARQRAITRALFGENVTPNNEGSNSNPPVEAKAEPESEKPVEEEPVIEEQPEAPKVEEPEQDNVTEEPEEEPETQPEEPTKASEDEVPAEPANNEETTGQPASQQEGPTDEDVAEIVALAKQYAKQQPADPNAQPNYELRDALMRQAEEKGVRVSFTSEGVSVGEKSANGYFYYGEDADAQPEGSNEPETPDNSASLPENDEAPATPAEKTTAGKVHNNAIEQIRNFSLSVDELSKLIQSKTVSLEEISEIVGKKFSRETKAGKAKSETELRRQVRQWYVQAKAEHNAQLSEADQKILEAANKKRAKNKKQAEELSSERAQDRADEESGIKSKDKTEDLTNSVAKRIPWRAPTAKDYDSIRTWIVDQITKGDITAEEISELLQKNIHSKELHEDFKALLQGKGDTESLNEKIKGGYSQRLIDLANSELTQEESDAGVKQTLMPNVVREYIIRGINDLAGVDIGLKGDAVQLSDIKSVIDEWRGKEAPTLVSHVELEQKAAEQKKLANEARLKFEEESKQRVASREQAPVVVIQEGTKPASNSVKAKTANPVETAKAKTLKGMNAVTSFAESALKNELPTGETSAEEAASIFSTEQIEALAKQHGIAPAEVRVALKAAAKNVFGKSFKNDPTAISQDDLIKEIDKLRSKGGKTNVRTTRPVDPRRVPTGADVFERDFRAIPGRRPLSEERANNGTATFRTEVEVAEKAGGKLVSYDESDEATKRVVERLLNGVEGDEKSRIPFVTIIDCSKMSEEAYDEIAHAGIVYPDTPEIGVFIYINAPGKKRIPRGIVILHEPTHYFVAEYELDREDDEDFEGIDFDSILAKGTSSQPAQNEAKEETVDKIIRAQLSYAGYSSLKNYLPSETEYTEADFKKLLDSDIQTITSKVSELLTEDAFGIQANYSKEFWDEVKEEALANLAAGAPIFEPDIVAMKSGFRNALYDSGIVPRGYYENLDAVADEFTKAQAKRSEAVVERKEADAKIIETKEAVRKQIQKFANGLQAKNIPPENVLTDPESKIIKTIAGVYKVSPQTVVKEAKKLLGVDQPKSRQLIDKATGEEIPTPHERKISQAAADYWLSRNVSPEGAINTRTNKEYAKYTTEAERRRNGGPIDYKSVSDVSVAKTAGENVINGLAKYGYEAVVESYKALAANMVNDDLIAREIVTLAEAIDQELWYRTNHEGRSVVSNLSGSNDILAHDSGVLWRLAADVTGKAASVLRRTTVLTPELQTMNNFIKTWAKNKTPESIDPMSDNAVLIRFGQDTVERVKEIEDDFKAGKEKEARQAMIDVLKEVNRVRNVRGIFTDMKIGGEFAGKTAAKLEGKLLDRVLKKSDFETIKMLTLGSLNRINSDFEKVLVTNTINQIRFMNMLSAPLTTLNNLLNNLESSTSGALANNLAYHLLGKKTAEIMGEQTLVKTNNTLRSLLPFTKVNKELNDYMKTKGAESVLSLLYGLDVDEGKIDLNLGAKHNQNSGGFGEFVARYSLLTGLKMTTTDAMAIARAYKGMEMEIDKLKVTKERKDVLKQVAMQQARTQMYHNKDSKIAKGILSLREGLDNATKINKDSSLGLGSVMVPFVQVPVNVASRALEATPAGVMYDLIVGGIRLHQFQAKADTYRRVQDLLKRESDLRDGKNVPALTEEETDFLEENRNAEMPTDFEVQKAAQMIGHAGVNSSALLVGILLSAMGVLKNFDDEDDEELKRLAKEKGYTGLQLNTSAILNGGKWNDDGDNVIGGSWLEVLSVPLVAGHAAYQALKSGKSTGDKLKKLALSTTTTVSQAIDIIAAMPGVDQFYDMWNAYQNLQKYTPEQEDRLVKTGESILQYGTNTLTSFAIPNSIATFTAGLDNTVRDIYNEDGVGQVMANIVKSKLPFARQTINPMKDSTGNVRTYGSNRFMGVLNKFILPGTGVKVWSRSELEREYARLKDGEDGVSYDLMPRKSAPKYAEIDKVKYDYNADEQRLWDELNTNLIVQGQNILIKTDGYKNMTKDEQGRALSDVKTLVGLVAHQTILDAKGLDDVHVDLKGWEKAYFGSQDNPPDFKGLGNFLVAKYTFRDIWDSKNNTFADPEAADKFITDIYGKLDDTAKTVLDSSYSWLDQFYKAKKDAGFTAKEFAYVKELKDKYSDMQDQMRGLPDDDALKESMGLLNRHMDAEFERYFGGRSKKSMWAQDNIKLGTYISASTETTEKWQTNTSLSTTEIDSWLTHKSKLEPKGGYKEPSINQLLLEIRDFNGISASSQKELEEKRWDMVVQMLDSKNSTAYEKYLKKYRDEGKSVKYALDNATYWYTSDYGKHWQRRKYTTIYPKDN